MYLNKACFSWLPLRLVAVLFMPVGLAVISLLWPAVGTLFRMSRTVCCISQEKSITQQPPLSSSFSFLFSQERIHQNFKTLIKLTLSILLMTAQRHSFCNGIVYFKNYLQILFLSFHHYSLLKDLLVSIHKILDVITYYFYFQLHVYVCRYMHCMQCSQSPDRESDTLKLELQMIVSQLIWLL